MTGTSPSGRPVRTVLEPLRTRIDLDRFDAALLELETVAADLGYGDVRALSGAVAWIDHLREHDKRIAVAASVESVRAAVDAGVYRVIAVARGLATPEQLRRAGAHGVVAELHELV